MSGELEALAVRCEQAAGSFLLKRWSVSIVWEHSERMCATVLAPTRGAALADTWRSDIFNGYTFGQFLRFARCRRDQTTPPRYGDPITVGGKPAFFVENNRQYVQFAYPGGKFVMNAHPYDVLPVEYRPDTYRDRDAETRAHSQESTTHAS